MAVYSYQKDLHLESNLQNERSSHKKSTNWRGGKFPEMEQNHTCVAQLELIRANLFGLGQNQFEFLVRLFLQRIMGLLRLLTNENLRLFLFQPAQRARDRIRVKFASRLLTNTDLTKKTKQPVG